MLGFLICLDLFYLEISPRSTQPGKQAIPGKRGMGGKRNHNADPFYSYAVVRARRAVRVRAIVRTNRRVDYVRPSPDAYLSTTALSRGRLHFDTPLSPLRPSP